MIPAPILALSYFQQWILYKSVPRGDGKTDKFPVDYRDGAVANAHDSAIWLPFDVAEYCAALTGFKVGFVFTANDPFFFVDIDNCRTPSGWSPQAMEICGQFPSAAIEVSQSGNGLHIIGMARDFLPHKCKNGQLNIELYHEARFMALGSNPVGAIGDCTEALKAAVSRYFPPSGDISAPDATVWTTEPCPEWRGPIDDFELLRVAMRAKGGSSIFGKKAAFKDLFEANVEALSAAFPGGPNRSYDASSADAALAQHLAFYTGKNCERIRTLMEMSAIRRDKWLRADYLPRTITRAVGLQQAVYSAGKLEEPKEDTKYPKLTGSDKQKEYADKIRTAKLERASEEQINVLIKNKSSSFWIDTKDLSLDEMCDKLKPNPMDGAVTEATLITGNQFMPAEKQIEYFKGCAYLSDKHEIFTPTGEMGQFLGPEAFNATYNGYDFQIDSIGGKPTKNAWDAFTRSQCVKFPKARFSGFRPDLPPGTISEYKKSSFFNTYIPYEHPRIAGDASPFINLTEKLLPNERDRTILLSYLAALIQYPGKKFRWAPLIQGTPGNGKTTISVIIKKIIGDNYTHVPRTKDLKDDFNAWIENKLLITVEDVYSPVDNREMIEILKPMVTNADLTIRGMHQIQKTIPNFANFIFNTNNKDALAKSKDDRRYAIFYTAHQTAEERDADGLTGAYFSRLYDWIDRGGTAIVNSFLLEYKIPEEFNPAKGCQVAPITSSTAEAIRDGLSPAQQEVVEAINSGEQGFQGGFISSAALDGLCRIKPILSKISLNRRADLLKSMGYIKHPALMDGRTPRFIIFNGENKRPILWIKSKHPALSIVDGNEITEMYMRAQGYISSS